MSNGNHVSITGNLTRDPELRFTPSGQPTTSFGVAVNRRWQNRQNQEWEEATSYFDVVCWGQLAENAAQSLGKGARIVVTGRLDQRSWENQDGERRSKIEITADEVAPSLRWATMSISKNERSGGNYQGGGGNYQGGGGNYSGGGNSSGNGNGGGYSGNGNSNGGGNYSDNGGGQPARSGSGDQGGGGAPAGSYQYEEEPF